MIVYRLQMLTAIRFNDKASAEVHEIDDVRPNRLLATELLSVQAMVAQMTPKHGLGVGHLSA